MTLAHHYALALDAATLNTSESGYDACIKNFIALLKRKRHYTLLPRVVKELLLIASGSKKKEATLLTVARKNDLEAALKEVSARGIETDQLSTAIDDTLIGGYVYDSGSVVIDASHKQSLLQLYRKLIA